MNIRRGCSQSFSLQFAVDCSLQNNSTKNEMNQGRTGKTVDRETGKHLERPADLPRDEETRVLLVKPHGITSGVVHSAGQTNVVEIVLVFERFTHAEPR
jgi:hypothetical protein